MGEAERLEIGPNEVREIVEDQVKAWETEKNK